MRFPQILIGSLMIIAWGIAMQTRGCELAGLSIPSDRVASRTYGARTIPGKTMKPLNLAARSPVRTTRLVLVSSSVGL